MHLCDKQSVKHLGLLHWLWSGFSGFWFSWYDIIYPQQSRIIFLQCFRNFLVGFFQCFLTRVLGYGMMVCLICMAAIFDLCHTQCRGNNTYMKWKCSMQAVFGQKWIKINGTIVMNRDADKRCNYYKFLSWFQQKQDYDDPWVPSKSARFNFC